MHGLGHIEINNFRICKQVSLPLGSFTPLVGQNNAGKSTILEAIKFVLAPRSFTNSDASDPDEPIIICARIDGIDVQLLDGLPDARHRAQIEPYCRDGVLWIRVTGPGKPKREVWDPAQYEGEGVPNVWREYPTGLPAAVSALMPEARHIEAMDDVQEDLGKGKAGSTIRSLLDDVMTPILEEHAEVSAALNSIRQVLGSNAEGRSRLLGQFDQEATAALHDFFPGLSVDIDMHEVQVKEFFRAGDLNVTDSASGDRRKFSELGTGAQRALQMALVRLLADRHHRAEIAPARRVLLIDEPELFLHPQGVVRIREALRTLSENGYQVIFATHSPLMINRDNAPDTVIVRRSPEIGVVAKPPLRSVVLQALEDAQAQSRTIFELGNVAEIFFSKKVVLCEGETDRRLLPLLLQIYRNVDDAEVCFVPLGSCSSIPKGMLVLNAMGIPCASIADLDFGFTHARRGKHAWLPADDPTVELTKGVLRKLRDEHGCTLGETDLPRSSSEWPARKTWALFARDADGTRIAREVHDALIDHGMWLWPIGSIEDALGDPAKGGEAVILEKEDRIRQMRIHDIEQQLPEVKSCLEWLIAE